MKITGKIDGDRDKPETLVDLEIELPLRDLFAAFALAGLYLSEETARANIRATDGVWQARTTAEEYASAAYDQADAMLAQRERGEG